LTSAALFGDDAAPSHSQGVAMSGLRFTGAVTGLALMLGAPSAWGASNEGGISADLKNEKLVRQMYEDLADAWNRHDVQALAAMWAIDGDHLEPDGTRAKGRDAVTKLFRRQHDTVFKETSLDMNIEDVWFHGDNLAIVDGTYALAGARTPNGTELPTRRGHFTAVLLYEEGRWWVAASRLMIPAPLPYKT
jgi:uncharacterized protein (TIGR02246 family)